jgi:shikimate kinase
MKNKNITLIGMSGAGKSTVGSALAQKLGWNFVDPDRQIEEEQGKQLQDILDEIEVEEFILLESKKVKEYIQNANQVLAPGGSIVYSQEAMDLLKDSSSIIYLEAPQELIQKRINTASRGIVGLENSDFASLHTERKKLYTKYADFIVKVLNKTPEGIVEEILSILN